ncbi:MAG: MATE family efflux transporter [Oleibacter sp.]|nr:MATE family efflux transporter [Thalassolituus sp.]
MQFRSEEIRAIRRLTLPILASQLAQIGIGTIDTIMSGYVSTIDLAAVAIGNAIWTPVWLFLAGVMVAISSAASRLKAAGGKQAASQLLGVGVALGLVSGLLCGLLIAVVAWAMPLIVDNQESAAITSGYLYFIVFAMPASGVFLALRFHAEALDDASQVTRIMLLGLLLNIPVNFVFVYGLDFALIGLPNVGIPAFGGMGCGIGSAIVMTYMAVHLVLNTRKRRMPENFSLWHATFEMSKTKLADMLRLTKLGLPIGIALFFEITLFTAIALFLTDLGPTVVAGHQVAINVSSLTFMIPLSLSMALTVRVGHHIGSGNLDYAKRCAWLGVQINIAIAGLNALIIILGSRFVADLYSPDPAVVAIGASLLMYAAVFQLSDSVQVAAAGALRGYEDTFAVMIITFVAYWLIGFGSGWYLAYEHSTPYGAKGFWMGLIIGLTVAAITLLWRLRIIAKRYQSAHLAAS